MLTSLLKRKDWPTWVATGISLIILIFLWPRIADFFEYSLAVLRYPYVWAMTENENMLFIHGIISGQNIYSLQNPDYFFYAVYPPLFHAISALFSKLFGLSIFIPRLISVLSLISITLTTVFLFRAKLKPVENISISILLVAFTTTIALYTKYFILARVDMLAYALAFGSLYFLWQIVDQKQDQRHYYWLAGGLAIAALFTKQSAFFPILALAGALLLVEDRRAWLKFGLTVAASTIAIFLLIQLITAGGFWHCMSLASETYGKYLNSWSHLIKLKMTFVSHYWPLILSVPIVAVLNWRSFSVWVFIAIYLNFLVTGGNQGAEHNTMIPLLFGLPLVAKELYTTKNYGRWIALGLCVLQLFILSLVTAPYLLPSNADQLGQDKLIQQLQSSSQSTILGDRIDYAILLAGKTSPLEASTHNVARTWEPTKAYAKKAEKNLLERLQSGQIDTAVVTITGFGKEELLNYIETHGDLVETIIISYVDAPEFPHKVYRFR